MVNYQNNQGVVLFIALVFLFISTLLGVSSLRSNFFNEKMTLSNIQREQALEAAEVALLAGEEFVESYHKNIVQGIFLTGTSDPTIAARICETRVNGGRGICVARDRSGVVGRYQNWVDIKNDINSIEVWSNSLRHRSLDEIIKNKYQLRTAPKYIVEFMSHVPDKDAGSICDDPLLAQAIQDQNDEWPYCKLDNTQFRITALATAGNYDETRVMLQSTYVVDN